MCNNSRREASACLNPYLLLDTELIRLRRPSNPTTACNELESVGHRYDPLDLVDICENTDNDNAEEKKKRGPYFKPNLLALSGNNVAKLVDRAARIAIARGTSIGAVV